MAEQDCGCNGELSGEHADGTPWIERTLDIGYCPKHAAVDDVIAALEKMAGLLEHWCKPENKILSGAIRVTATGYAEEARDTIRKAKG